MNLRLLQLCDSAFPAGAYAFSDGLETLTTRGEVGGAADLTAFLRGQLAHGWGVQDAPACALAWRAGAGALRDLDALLDDLKLVEGPRRASLRVGVNLRRAARTLWPAEEGALCPTRHHATTFGALAGALGATREAAVTAYVSAWLLGRATSATRLMRLGGLEAQACAAACEAGALACVEAALLATPEDLGGFSPLLDVAAAEQAGLESRLFQT
ncbi:urease accessory protein UreF [Deinococcus gobiensis]|uniref:Urease accessory protein UreF n=1 Tax=Deinococcus gobiensis (strain DSM 21396 / JCM 16679 / CGMCC 1.7299 / I-0) TaxID=745776 RepID=H8GXM2_DEIGI|nr:urease accessory UreF family protein [Deinococcus gobiensis]AFD24682.1 Urease accessory protein UreF [Deinococcus gobiensis I-0]